MSTAERAPMDRAEPRQSQWTRPMWYGLALVLCGSVGALAAWIAWSSPGHVSALFDVNVGDLTPEFALQFGSVPGSQSGLASSRGSVGVVIALVLIAIVVATRYAKDQKRLLVGCTCCLAVASIGLVVNAYAALRETLNATKAIDQGLNKIVAATTALPSLPVLGSVSDIVATQVHHARQHVVSHSVVPAVVGLAAGGVALLGSLVLLTGTLRRSEVASADR